MRTRTKQVLGGVSAVLFILILWALYPSMDFGSSGKIGVVEIRGLIDNSQDTVKAIKEFRKQTNIRAIVLRIESPGGGIGPSQEIYREVRRTIGVKPVVASLGSIAASGGYYIACASNRIVANPGTITGSIGVIINMPMLRDLFGKIGYDMVTIKSGKFKDTGNPAREMTPEERELLQVSVDEAFRQFVDDVAKGRSMPEADVRAVADGRILMGQTAQQLGLVDELGNFEDGVRAAAALAKIEGEPDLTWAKKKKKSVLDYLLGTDVSDRVSGYLDGSLNFLRYELPFPGGSIQAR